MKYRITIYGTDRKTLLLSRLDFERLDRSETTQRTALSQARRFLIDPRIVSVERVHQPAILALQ